MLSHFPSLIHYYYHTPKLFFFSPNWKSSYVSPQAIPKKSSSTQHNKLKPLKEPLLEPSFLEVFLNASDDFIDTYIDPPRHPFVDPECVLSDNFAPVDELPPTECEVVKGTLPPCLNGDYIRNGANPQYFPRGPFHFFDGDGMLHSTKISQGKAIFCSHYVKTYKYLVEKKTGYSVIHNVFSDFNSLIALVIRGAMSITRIIIGQFDPSNGFGPANTSLALFGGKLFALYESDIPYAIKLAPNGDIITIGCHNFDGNLSIAMTSHLKIDPNTNEAFAFRYDPILFLYLTYFRIHPNGVKSHDLPIFYMTRPSFVHDFAITKNYAIFPDIQIEMNLLGLITGGAPVGTNSRKVPRLGVIPRYAIDESEMRWFKVSGFNMMHAINAWEEDNGDTIVVIAPNILSIEHFLKRLKLVHATIEQVKIDLKTGKVSRNQMSKRNLELACINRTYIGKKNKYVRPINYEFLKKNCIAFFRFFKNYQIKLTYYIFKKNTLFNIWQLSEFNILYIYAAIADPLPKAKGMWPQEFLDQIVSVVSPFFVPKDHDNVFAVDEDDGYVVCYMHNESTRESSFMVMDAKTRDLEIVAVVKLPHRVPYGFHGIFVKESDRHML
ncbi:hypothetical protein H5410_039752 [Solanum commersonii]|uniref:Carotenoid oxygenase n=1 Tax=Solanum commersonii TaxID=4109 RepID=A0A9J5XQI6_SOLCO|nr:hypothetical protein H5410_039752 [Solanum commersonii]